MSITQKIIFVPFFLLLISSLSDSKNSTLKILTVANTTASSDTLERYRESAILTGLDNFKVIVLGQGSTELENPAAQDPSTLLIDELKHENYNEDDVILFTQSHHILLMGNSAEILQQFYLTQADLLLSPDFLLGKFETKNQEQGHQFGIGGFIGYKSKILDILVNLKAAKNSRESHPTTSDQNDDRPITSQIYEYHVTSNGGHNDEAIKIDSNFNIFSSLNEAKSSVELVLENGTILRNGFSKNKILILHGDGPKAVTLSFFGNFVLDQLECQNCLKNAINLEDRTIDQLPTVTMGIFIDQPTPFLEEFFNKIHALDYPKQRTSLLLYNNAAHHDKLVLTFLTKWTSQYAKVKTISPRDEVESDFARQLAINLAVDASSDFYFSINSIAHIDNPLTLRHLIAQNRQILAPLLIRPNRLWSNFQNAVNSQGFYERFDHYVNIVKGKWRGLWNVPCIMDVYLINGTVLRDNTRRPNYLKTVENPKNFVGYHDHDQEDEFCRKNRQNGVFMFVTNREDFGHLVNADHFENHLEAGRLHGELVEFFTNELDWKDRYLHPDWSKSLSQSTVPQQPCPDVYWFPILTPRFCSELIQELEHFGNWSDYKPVEDSDPAPTADIGLQKIGMEDQFIEFLRMFVQPLQKRVYPDYTSKPFRTDTPFVIRYQPDGRKMLNPHLDISTYTINIALNYAKIDYEGGGVRFTRYNCSVLENNPGWLLMHPGELSHQHHGLVVTKGTRYVLIAFIDPPD